MSVERLECIPFWGLSTKNPLEKERIWFMSVERLECIPFWGLSTKNPLEKRGFGL